FGNDKVVEASGNDSGQGTDTLDFSAVSAPLTATINPDSTFTVGNGTSTVSAANVENLIGGSGSDTLDYSKYSSGVTVDLASGVATNFVDVSGFENVIGSAFSDSIAGDSGANILSGGPGGNDLLSGRGGNDTITGGAGGINTLVESLDASMTLTNSS